MDLKCTASKSVLAFTIAASLGAPALAQTPAATSAEQDNEIIVTARKRAETLISVPVVITAVSGEELVRRGVNSMDGLARLVPQLVVGEGAGTVQGGNIALRGISGADANPFADQAVSFNIDGVQVARASVRRMAQMDMQQIEVLKGPQALFYGKNSPGGIISIRTADPTPDFQAMASAAYEFNAAEWRGEGYISGPISDNLGFRIAAFGSKQRGWVKNITPRDSIYAPNHKYGPRANEFAIRGTLKYEAADNFDARLKLTYNRITGDASTGNLQLVDCPTGSSQFGQVDNCKADDEVSVGYLGPNFANRDPRYGSGKTFLRQNQLLGSLELNYHPSDEITLTSVTGIYHVKLRNLGNFTATNVPTRMLPALNLMNITEKSQELRATSDYDGPVNFMIGGHFQETEAKAGSTTLLNGAATLPTVINNYLLKQKGKAYSAFMQVMWDITDTLELSGGGRYSHERKRLPWVRSGTGVNDDGTVITPPPLTTTVKSKASWNDFSPEVTLSYRPSQNLTVFGSYKHGFISGGFNSGSANFANPLDYDQQTVKGFEGGIKAALLDGALRTNLALFNYEVKGLQVQVTTQGTIQELKNVGRVRTKGGEFDFHYKTPISGLSFHGAVAYDKGRYTDYFASCYRGQTKAMGCNYVPVPGQPGEGRVAGDGSQPGTSTVPGFEGTNYEAGSLQDLTGTELLRAPKWTGNVGLTYETPISSGLKIGFSGDMTFSASYITDSSSRGRQPNYQIFDASFRLAQADDKWEIALIGRNLTDEYYYVRTSDVPFSGTAPGNQTGTATLGDLEAAASRGREVMLRVTTRF